MSETRHRAPLVLQHKPGCSAHTYQGPGSELQSRRQESCPEPTSPRAGSGGRAEPQTCPGSFRPGGSDPRPPARPRPGSVRTAGAGETLPALPEGRAASKLLTGGFQQQQPQMDLNWCPGTENSKFCPQPPQNFHLPRSTQREEEETLGILPRAEAEGCSLASTPKCSR